MEGAVTYHDGTLSRFGWEALRIAGRFVGVRPARSVAALFLSRSARRSDVSWWKTAHRVSQRLRDANPQLVKIPPTWLDHEPRVRVRRMGVDLELDLRDNLQALVFFTGIYEPTLSRFLRDELRAGDVFADVGAHIGVHALRAARHLEDMGGGHVIAFEPAPDSAEKLRSAARNNQLDVEVVECGLSNRPGRVALYADPRYAPEDAGVRSMHGTGAVIAEVETVTLDAWAKAHDLARLDVVKIDVEGHEFRVLDGMRETLARLRPRALCVEIKENSLGRAPESDEQLDNLLGELNYGPTGDVCDHNALFRPRGPRQAT